MTDVCVLVFKQDHVQLAKFAAMIVRHRDYFIAWGLIGLPVPPVMISGGPQKKNS
jgi:hypothetical protein